MEEDYLRIFVDAGVIITESRDTVPSLQTSCGTVLLHVAAISGSVENIDLLLKLGFKIDVKSKDNLTPLCRAVRSGQFECVKLLIEKGANIQIKPPSGGTLLHLAASSGQPEIVKLLLKKGLQIDAKDEEGLIPVYRAIEKDMYEAASVLLDEAEEQYFDCNELLHLAASRGCLVGIRCCLDLGYDVDALDTKYYTPLYCAAKAGKLDAIEELINNGANLFIRDQRGDSLLHCAAEEGDLLAIKTLIEAGIDVNIPGGWWGRTPLHVSAAKGHLDVVKLLVDKNAAVDCRSTDGHVPIDFALRNNSLETVCFLSSFEKVDRT